MQSNRNQYSTDIAATDDLAGGLFAWTVRLWPATNRHVHTSVRRHAKEKGDG